MSRAGRFLTPTGVITLVGIVVVLFLLLVPQDTSESGPFLDSHSTGPRGARGLYDVLRRLGYRVSRDTSGMSRNLDSSATYVILSPVVPLTDVDVNSLLAVTRRGATLILAGAPQQLIDSLGFTLHPIPAFETVNNTVISGGTPAPAPPMAGSMPQFIPISWTVTPDSATRDSIPPFLWLEDLPDSLAVIAGRRFGAGHAVVVSDPEILANRVLRDGRPAIAVVHALEWSAGERAGTSMRRVVFDEYHHGFGTHADVVGTVWYALTGTPAGRMVLQGAAAALVLILAVGARPIAPVSTGTIQRRSPLEHVDALAHAYMRVNAVGVLAERLVQGLRRRHPLGMAPAVPHQVYLGALSTRLPEVARDVKLVSAAVAGQMPTVGSGGDAGHGIPGETPGGTSVVAAVAGIESRFGTGATVGSRLP